MSDTEAEGITSDGGVIDIHAALQEVLKRSLINNGLVRGLHEVVKALEKSQAKICVLAENCDEAMYRKLVISLCKDRQIPLLTVEDNKKLGEWAGLCKIDSTGKARKIVGCSCICVKEWGEETPALDALKDHLKTLGEV